VFRPTFLTILGALLYLREGWLVGNGGLLGAWLVIGAAATITGTTAMSAASIATNQRVRPGGAFAIISHALGLEAGGAIGVPLYIAQSLSAAMYAYAFGEAFLDSWTTLGGRPMSLVLVALVAFLAVSGIALRSAAVAFRAQGVLFWIVLIALASLFTGVFTADLHAPTLLPLGAEVGVVDAFAIFFPALTGIMVGVGMSGQLTDSARSIPRGTVGAWGVTTCIYVLAALWYALVASPEDLLHQRTIVFDHALSGWTVRLGLLVSTLMAALSSLVAASALLAAMAGQGLLPMAGAVGRRAADGEPRRATVVTIAIASLGLLSGSLDAIAPIVTAFFILTYLALNSVVLLEQRLGMISFRPTFRVPDWVPALGVVACGTGLFFASPRPILLFGLLAVVVVYVTLAMRDLETPWETVRSGIGVALASWAARRAAVAGHAERSWKPDLLGPMARAEQENSLGPLLQGLAAHHGSVKVLAVGDDPALRSAATQVRDKLLARGVFATAASVSAEGFATGFTTALDAMQADLFPPNIVVLDATLVEEGVVHAIHAHCRKLGLGLAVYVPGPDDPLGKRRTVDVWLSYPGADHPLALHTANLDLPVLVGWMLREAWDADLTLVTAADDAAGGRRFLDRVVSSCRLGHETVEVVVPPPFPDALANRRPADLHILGMPPEVRREVILRLAEAAGGACLFLMDSGRESALA